MKNIISVGVCLCWNVSISTWVPFYILVEFFFSFPYKLHKVWLIQYVHGVNKTEYNDPIISAHHIQEQLAPFTGHPLHVMTVILKFRSRETTLYMQWGLSGR